MPNLVNSGKIIHKVTVPVLGLVFLLLNAACSAGQDRLVLHTDGGDVTVNVEIADNDEARSRGLMFRQSLDEDKGMLFDFHEERPVSFWMRNTFIPLDMIFIAADGTIRKIHANARPYDETPVPSDGPVRFVLEIGGGRAAVLGLKAGDTISHPLVEKRP